MRRDPEPARATPPTSTTPTRKVRLEALKRALREAEAVVLDQDHLLRRLGPWVAPRP